MEFADWGTFALLLHHCSAGSTRREPVDRTDAGLAHWVNQRFGDVSKGDFVDSVAEDETGKIWVRRFRLGDYSHPLCEVVDTAVRCYGSEDGVPPLGGGPLVQDTSGNLGQEATQRFSNGGRGHLRFTDPRLCNPMRE